MDLREILAGWQSFEAPSDDDPGKWTPPEVTALVLQYGFAVEALPNRDNPEWSSSAEIIDDILFTRDLLQEWLDRFEEDALDEILPDELADIPFPSESDQRLEDLYRENRRVREILDGDYVRFRDDVQPDRRNRWWWLDAELFGQRIH